MGRAEERQARQRGARRAARGRPAGGGKPKRTGIRRFFTLKKILGTFFGVCLLGLGAFVVLYLVIDIPAGNAAAKRQSNVYKYSDGSILARDGKVNREIVDLEKVPKDVQRTFVAAENKSFYKDTGVDFKGTARGLINTVSGKGKQGGSTITQQYVKNYYLTQDQTVTRKLKELVISLKVDREKSKDDILAGYINTSYYGRGAYGIQAAAQAYYGVDASGLEVQQGAYLAALLQAPSQYDWAAATPTGKKLAKERWNYVLDNMVEKNWLDSGKRAGLKFPVPDAPKPAPGMEGQTGYLVQAADAVLEKQLVDQGLAESESEAEAQVEAGGYTITLNIDKKKQQLLEKAVDKKLNKQLDPDKRKADARVQAGAASVDPKTGKVLAMYGGEDYVKHFTNNATRRDYQPASTFKPLILAAALENGAKTQSGQPITANTIYDGTSKRPVKGSDVGFAPPNEDDKSYGPVTVQKAMNKSINSVFAQMGVDVGMDEVLETAGKLGMDVEDLPAVPAQTLGTMGASPLEMAGVYATLDNHGKKVTPRIVASVEHKDRTIDLPDAIGEEVVERGTADSLTSVLTGVVDDGTGRAVRSPVQDVAGKTGTSDDNKSAWFVGYTPKLVTSVGLFGEGATGTAEQSKQVSMKGAGGLPRVDGGSFPAQIWAAYTFDAMGSPSEFDLDTSMGAAIAPPPEPTTQAPKEPTEEPSETEDPTTKPPTDDPTTEKPTQTPTTESPTEDPTTEPPTDDTESPDPTDSIEIPENPNGRPGRD
ncbi:transglycosylase domain-containing protein [Streptomyces sp. NPDC050147]|uniref:transglycosylase domain-containing protein n=1 Tax=Streptomyces sp. NPDC050147 TaxID=3155513 RepID=UPI0034361EE4